VKTTTRLRAFKAAALLLFVATTLHAQEDQHYSQEVFFENSATPDSYFYSAGRSLRRAR